jgi:hypothetical protein
VIAELESRGEDLSDLKIGLLPLLREIAAGTLLPEVVVKFAGQPAALRAIGKRPMDEQEQYVRGEKTFELPPPRKPFQRRDGLPVDRRPESTLPIDGVQVTARDMESRREQAAAKASPRDVGEMAAGLVLRCPEAEQAAWRVIESIAEPLSLPKALVDRLRDILLDPKTKAQRLRRELILNLMGDDE